jgi:hypothetical protein
VWCSDVVGEKWKTEMLVNLPVPKASRRDSLNARTIWSLHAQLWDICASN